jgi:hypothetical protein
VLLGKEKSGRNYTVTFVTGNIEDSDVVELVFIVIVNLLLLLHCAGSVIGLVAVDSAHK